VTWAPASAGVTFVVRDARPTCVIPAEAGIQDTAQRAAGIDGAMAEQPCEFWARSMTARRIWREKRLSGTRRARGLSPASPVESPLTPSRSSTIFLYTPQLTISCASSAAPLPDRDEGVGLV